MLSPPSTGLSPRDAGVLSLLFDLEPRPLSQHFDQLQVLPKAPSLASQQLTEIQLAERCAIQLAEKGLTEEAERLLSDCIEKYPTARPSLWSNRAQVRRLTNNTRGALSDLSQAIWLGTPPQNATVACDAARELSFAHAHRATIYLLAARGEIYAPLDEESPERLEEKASYDFAMAGKYGSELARAMAVRTNPYAKLCEAIVQTALSKEIQPLV